jgi:hypothetical protein
VRDCCGKAFSSAIGVQQLGADLRGTAIQAASAGVDARPAELTGFAEGEA